MTVNELILELQKISFDGNGNLPVYYIRPSDIARPGADEKIVTSVMESAMATPGKDYGIWLM